MNARLSVAALVVGCALAAACGGGAARAPVAGGSAGAPAGVVRSNVLRADYAGSAACARCHEAITAKWAASPMHNMTRDVPRALPKAPFTGTALRFKDDRVDVASDGDARFVVVTSKPFGDHVYRVTRVIGGHYREDYAGREVAAPKRDARVIGSEEDELVLPVSYLLFDGTWRYKGYSVMAKDRPGLRAGPTWNQTCILCHNTAPYLTSIYAALDGAKHASYQGETVDALLPPERRWHVSVSDRGALDDALVDETARLLGTAPRTSDRVETAISATRDAFHADDLIEVGIGCEACHGGCKEHVAEPKVKPSLLPHAASFTFEGAGTTTKAGQINHTCARCHQVLFSRYPWTWEGGSRNSALPGGSHVNSGEARDMMLGHCAGEMACTQCHDPHDQANRTRAAVLETRTGDRVCIACHAKYDGDAALAAHAHHAPDGAGARCVACHMPKKNMTLDLGLGRYHRIGSPTDAEKVRDRPLECALCHGDRSAAWIVDAEKRFWGKTVDRSVLDAVYGSADTPILEATLARGRPHEKAVALVLLGDTKDRRYVRPLADELANEYPLVRFYALAALGKVLGTKPDVDLYAEPDEIRARAARISP